MKFHVEHIQSHVWGPLGAQSLSTFVEHVFIQRSLGVKTIAEKSIANYIEWCSQNTTIQQGWLSVRVMSIL